MSLLHIIIRIQQSMNATANASALISIVFEEQIDSIEQ